MQESSLNKYKNWSKHEIFSKTCIPPETPFFIRLDGWKFKKLSEAIKAEKPFDKKFAKCLVSSGKILFKKGFNPALIYIASDELNILFLDIVPFRGRIEKINSIIASLVSSAFSLDLQRFFNEKSTAVFDSRVVIASTEKRMVGYLSWRQMNTWRNHNNAYAYWIFRKMRYKSSEIAKKLKGFKTEELYEMMFEHGMNLAKTPQWQRRGILVYKRSFLKKVEKHLVTRCEIKEDWNLPLFTSKDGTRLIKQILEWMKEKGKK